MVQRTEKKRQRKRPARGKAAKAKKRRLWPKVLLALGVGAITGVALMLGSWALQLPDVDEALAASRPPVVTILDRHGERVAAVGGTGGTWIAHNDMPQVLVDAVLAIEDRRFHNHGGLDVWGVLRAIFANLRAGDFVQGGSTITQQLAKNMFLKPDRTAKRKLQEVMLAYALERRLSKEAILEHYLNRVYLGSGAYGIDAAARRYFGVGVRGLTLPQAAMIAGLLKAPTRYSPINDPQAAEARMSLVLDAMVEHGSLAPERREAITDPPPLRREAAGGTQYFVDWVMGELPDYVGEPLQDITVYTAFDPVLQRAAQELLADALAKNGNDRRVGQGAVVAMSPEGAVRALVGGREYRTSPFNRAVRALRQPGSAFKLFVYLAAFEAGMTPRTRLRDSPFVYRGWRPQNYGGGHVGSVSLKTAFAKSINTVAVKAAEAADRSRVIGMAKRLGITTPIVTEPSLALGTSEVRLIELTGAFAVVANGGYRVFPHGITEVRTPGGGIFYERSVSRDRVIEPGLAKQMDSLLRAVVTSGTGRAAAHKSVPAAGKTGTSQDWRDAWFVGYSDDLVAGVWLGNDDSTPMNRVTGGGLPARLWRDLMTRAETVP